MIEECPRGPVERIVRRRRKKLELIVGRAYRLKFPGGNINNCKMHVRAIVDTYQVVVAVHGKRKGWRHRLEDLRILEMWWDEGVLTLAPNT